MIQKSNKEKILALFFDKPLKGFQLREISKLTGIGLPSVKNYAEAMVEEGVLRKAQGQVFPYFIAEREGREFRLLRLAGMLRELDESELLAELEKMYPDCIVLFGSAARGEDTEKSDIDLFVQAKEKGIDLRRFEKLLGRPVKLMFEQSVQKLPAELRNNLANGIVLRGYLKVI